MAISKITLNGVTQMDVTQKTVTANTMLNGITSLKNDGTDITGNIQSKTSSDLTVSGATVTAPAGHYQNAASKTIPNADATGVLDSDSFYTDSGNRRWRIYVQGYAESGGYVDDGAFGSPNGYNYPAVAANTFITPTESAQTVGGSKYMMEGAVTVNAIPSNYVGSGITQRSSSDLTASGATVTAPAGYYGSAATKSVASGTAGTPTASKGTVSNHAISVTPSVTNTTGYIEGGTKTGTAVSVSASELVSGTKSISSSGTTDVTNYASASVAAGSLAVGASKGTVSSHSISVSPYVDSTSGFVGTGRTSGTAVTVSASELVSGTLSITSSGTKDVTNYASASVAAGTEGTPTATKGTVSGNQVTVTPSVTNSAGYISGGTHTGTGVTVAASELVSGSETITSNGNFDVSTLASIIANFPDSWEAESGTFTPASDTITYEVSFSKTHEELPFYTLVVDVTNTYNTTTYTSAYMSYFNWQTLWGNPFYVSTNTRLYGVVNARYRNTSTTAVSISNWNIYYSQNTTDHSTNQYPRYWVTESGMHCEASASSYWRSNRTYNWIAVWRPTIKPSWEYGTINTSTGANGSAATNRLRTTTYIPVTSTTQIYLKSDANVALLGYTSSNAFVENSLGWLTSSFNLATALADYPTITKVRLMAKKTDGSTITDVQTLAGNIIVKGLA